MRTSFYLGGLLLTMVAVPAAAAPPPRPALVVAISVDQFSAALFEQYRTSFTGGLKQLQGGVAFPSGYQSHAATETCPGHSTLLTGQHPSATGIVANAWYDRKTGSQVYCVYDAAGPVPGREPKDARGPANLKASTLGEWLRAANPASRVYAVAGKDRAAITMAGRGADGVFWWDEALGLFTTSVPAGTDTATRLAPVKDFNAALVKRWTRNPPVWRQLDKSCKFGGESRFGDLTLAHTMPPAGRGAVWNDAASLANFRATPALDQVTLDAAKMLIDRFRLGRGTAPDLLAVSLSATDYVGHRFGAGGPEMCDQLAHLDRALGVFLKQLAALRVPVVVALSADHGGIDAAERVALRGFPAERRDSGKVLPDLNQALRAELGIDFDAAAGDYQQIALLLDRGEYPDPGRDRAIADAALRWLRARADVYQVFTRAEVVAAKPRPGTPVDELSLAERFHESYDPDRSGDIMVAYRPYASGGRWPKAVGDYVAGHGSPWNYDRRVPMLFWWPGATRFEQSLPVETVDIAPTLAALLGVTPPPVAGRCLDLDPGAGDSCGVR